MEKWIFEIRNVCFINIFIDTDQIGRLIVRFAANKAIKPNQDGGKWHELSLEQDGMSLTFDFRVRCNRQYFGENCTEYCSAAAFPGRFTCSSTGQKVCRKGWTGTPNICVLHTMMLLFFFGRSYF